MIIRWCDEMGIAQTMVDEYGISFNAGYAIFSDGEHDYTIPMENLMEIQEENYV